MKKYLLCILSAVVLTVSFCADASAARKSRKKAIPAVVWQDMSRGEHIAALTLTPLSKPAVRSYMQGVEEKLVACFPGIVTTMRDSLIACVTLSSIALYAPNDTLLSAEGVSTLKKMVDVLSPADNYRFVISAHTADVGSEAYLTRLSQQRADAVAQELSRLIGENTVAAPFGLGASEPLSKNKSYSTREANRRVEIWIIPSPELVTRLTPKKK